MIAFKPSHYPKPHPFFFFQNYLFIKKTSGKKNSSKSLVVMDSFIAFDDLKLTRFLLI